MRKLTLKELEELNQINNNEIYRLRKIITQQGKDIVSKDKLISCLLYTSPSPRDRQKSRMPSSA